MFAAIARYADGGPIAAVEASLIGTLILSPINRLDEWVSGLRAQHFSDPDLGRVFEEVMAAKHPEAVLVAESLHSKSPGRPWAALVSGCLSDTLVDDEAVSEAAMAVRGDFAKRSAERRRASK